MTSKEALTELFNEANRFPFEKPKYDTYDLLKMSEQIQNDLEVIEIIKKHIVAKTYEYGTDFDSYNKISLIAEIIQLKDFTNKLNGIHYTICKVDNDFEKIKEWLDNE